MKRRFFPLEQEFRAITYTSPNSVQMICLASDGHSIWLFDALEGNLKLLFERSTDKFTTIQMKNETELLIGTFNGEIVTKSLQNDSLESQKYSEFPIISICNDLNHFFDSQGRLFSNGKVISDDGILQPCRLLKSLDNLFFVKHCSIYIFDNNDKHLKTTQTTGLICAAELNQEGNLIISTATSQIFLLDGDFNLKELSKNNSEAQEDSEDENGDSQDESDLETEDLTKSEQVYSLIQSPNSSDMLVLKVDSINKRSWIETISASASATSQTPNNHTSDTPHQTAKIICPLCCDKKQQTLPLNTSKCTKGHPITICAQTGNLITTKCFRCRDCSCAFSTNPETCPFCKGLITK